MPTRPHSTEYHVLHADTDAGIEGVCTVGDARYTTMRTIDLEHLRHLVIGENPLDRNRLDSKLRAATRHIFTMPDGSGHLTTASGTSLAKPKTSPFTN